MRVVIRIRRRASRMSRFVTGSLAVHAVLVALVLALPGFAKRPSVPEDALFVELAGGLPAPRGAPAAAVAEPPAPAPPPEGPSAVKEVPPPAKRPAEPKKEKKPEPKPEPAPAPGPPGPPAAPGVAGGSAFPEAAGTGITAVGSGDPTLAGYYARVSALLNGQWIRPVLLEEGGEPRSAVVSFEIARNGTVINLEVEEGSGLDVLDRSALRAVLDASPLPPPPGGWRGASVPVRVRFVLDPQTP